MTTIGVTANDGETLISFHKRHYHKLTMGVEMKEHVLVILGAAAAAALGMALWLIGSETLRTMGLILVGGLVAAAMIGASALPIRAWRRRDATGETHYYHDGTVKIIEKHTLDGRVQDAPKLLQLPMPPQADGFPELLRAAWQAGALTNQASPHPEDLREVDPRNPWGDDIIQ